MASNRGVVYLGPSRVEVQKIDFPTFRNPAGKTIDHGVILKVIMIIPAGKGSSEPLMQPGTHSMPKASAFLGDKQQSSPESVEDSRTALSRVNGVCWAVADTEILYGPVIV